MWPPPLVIVDDVNGASFNTERDTLFLHGPDLQIKVRFYSFGQLFEMMWAGGGHRCRWAGQ